MAHIWWDRSDLEAKHVLFALKIKQPQIGKLCGRLNQIEACNFTCTPQNDITELGVVMYAIILDAPHKIVA